MKDFMYVIGLPLVATVIIALFWMLGQKQQEIDKLYEWVESSYIVEKYSNGPEGVHLTKRYYSGNVRKRKLPNLYDCKWKKD